jgi:hypothetical protein
MAGGCEEVAAAGSWIGTGAGAGGKLNKYGKSNWAAGGKYSGRKYSGRNEISARNGISALTFKYKYGEVLQRFQT